MVNNVKTKNNLVISIMLGSFAFGFMSFILPIYTKKIGGNALSIGGLFSIFSIVTLILRPMIGKGIDTYGRKKFFVSAFVFYALSMMLFSYSTNITLLYISRFIQAIGSSFMWISAYSIAIDLADTEKRGKTIGQVDGASAKGALYGAVIGFIILGNFTLMSGWSILFKGYAVLSLVAGYIAYKHIPETASEYDVTVKLTNNQLNSDFYKLLVIVFITAISSSMLSPLLMIYLQHSNINFALGSRVNWNSHGFSGRRSICSRYRRREYSWVCIWLIFVYSKFRGFFGPLLGGWLYDYFGHAIPFYINGIILLLNALFVIVLI